MTLNCQGKLLDINSPKIMGILNCTPDSFYDGGKYNLKKDIIQRIDLMVEEGADIIDVGGQSTRPGATLLSAEEEWEQVIFALEYLQKNYPEQIVSLDSFWSQNHLKADAFGVAIINDISAGQIDSQMFSVVSSLKKPYVLMHMKGTPETMHAYAKYENMVTEINYFFSEKIFELNALGVNDIILDPGFGFAKTIDQNFQLLSQLQYINFGALPLMVGISRKSMIYKTLQISIEESLEGTSILNFYALEKGAKIFRVHDVKNMKHTLTLWKKLNNS